jgi:hypothetical protein
MRWQWVGTWSFHFHFSSFQWNGNQTLRFGLECEIRCWTVNSKTTTGHTIISQSNFWTITMPDHINHFTYTSVRQKTSKRASSTSEVKNGSSEISFILVRLYWLSNPRFQSRISQASLFICSSNPHPQNKHKSTSLSTSQRLTQICVDFYFSIFSLALISQETI